MTIAHDRGDMTCILSMDQTEVETKAFDMCSHEDAGSDREEVSSSSFMSPLKSWRAYDRTKT